MFDFNHFAQIAGFVQLACSLPETIRAAVEAEAVASPPLAFGKPSEALSTALRQIRVVLDKGCGVLQPELSTALHVAWTIPAALNTLNGRSLEVPALFADLDAFFQTLLRTDEVLEAQRARIEPGALKGAIRTLDVAKELLRCLDDHAATFSSLAGVGPFRTGEGDGRRPIDEWKDHLVGHIRFIEARLAEHQRRIDSGASGFQTPFKFKNQLVQIRAPTMKAFAWGASGMVVRAFIQTNNTRLENVVLKILHRVNSPHDRESLRREVEIWSQMDHARVLPYYGMCEVPNLNQTALVSPYMKHGNMASYLEKNADADRLTLVRQVVEGLKYLHDTRGVVHGDLKCENVLITNHGEAMLSDFGLSTLVTAGSNITATEIRGRHTVRFAAPELLSDTAGDEQRRSKTKPSDVYAFGMVIYQAYTGTPPWPTIEHDVALIIKIIDGEVPPRQNGLLNDALWGICERCWRRDPHTRPPVGRIHELLQF
ncbi:kinase-like protein [Auricularia subglabra TFB-10046 SS5]|nr:kinase-like protein [Auricularia subglabra TFB-10046 SS5]